MSRVVITGMGIMSPTGNGLNTFSQNLKAGKSGIKFIQELKDLGFGCQIGGIPEIDSAEHKELLSKYTLDDTSFTIKLAVLSALEAWENAKLVINNDLPDRDTAIFIGSGIGSADLWGERIVPMVNNKEHKKFGTKTIEHLMFGGATTKISGILGLGNKSLTLSNACASGTNAIIEGYYHVKEGRSTRALVGGTEGYSPYYWSIFDAMRLVMTRKFNDTPSKGSCPMSKHSSGFVPGAAAGFLVLETYESAKKRSANIFAEIISGFSNTGGQREGGSMTMQNYNSMKYCIEETIRLSGINKKEIGLISGHLTSTSADPIEVKCWREIFSNPDFFPVINSLKSMTGHCIGAAGAIETIAATLQLYENFIHPSINCNEIHPEIEKLIPLDKIATETTYNHNIEYAIKASFGFGDVNSCLILKNYCNE